jgi:cysteine-rich repeat protein
MTRIGIVLGVGLGGVVALGMLQGGMLREATAAKNPAKASVKCRKTIGQNVLKAVTAGLKTMQRCHVQRLKGRGGGDCNSLSGAVFERSRAQAVARINVACRDGDPVAANYNAASVAQGFPAVLDAIRAALEESAAALQAAVVFDGDAAVVKAKKKCHGVLGSGRTAVVQAVVKAAFKCQQAIDKRAQGFGPIAASCLLGSGGAGGRASGQISRACGAFGGLEVGSCAALPGCLVSAGEATGQRIARLTFGGPAVCGDGLQDVGEECDDGNTIEADGCRATCQLPVCGDLAVNQPSEECDEMNGLGGDVPTENCYECRLNVCGDGRLDTEEPGLEECDGSAADDACPDRCTDTCTCGPVLCGPNGLTARMALAYDEAILGGVSATRLELSYPVAVGIPGTGFASTVRDRVTTPLSAEFNFLRSDVDADADGIDDFVRAVIRAPVVGSIDPQVVVRVQFDCAPGTPVLPAALPCTIPELIMLDGSPFPDELRQLASCVVTLEPTP